MEGDHEIAKIIYTDGWYSIFDDAGDEHLYDNMDEEHSLENDPDWELLDSSDEEDREVILAESQSLAMGSMDMDLEESPVPQAKPKTPNKRRQSGPRKRGPYQD